MSLGGTGNGFDFLIDPYRFGGARRDVTSTPYATVALDSFDAFGEGAFGFDVFGVLDDFTSSSRSLAGDMRSILLSTSYSFDAINSSTAVALGGNLGEVLVFGGTSLDEFNGAGSTALEGSMSRILISLSYSFDGVDGQHAVALGGTLT